MGHLRAEIDHMRLQAADADHVGAQFLRLLLDLRGHRRRIVDCHALRIHRTITIGRQFNPTGAISLNDRFHRRKVA